MTVTAIRHIEALRALPLGRWTTTAQVHAALTEKGYTLTRRTIQRDLLKLAAAFGIEYELRATAPEYLWRRTQPLEVSE